MANVVKTVRLILVEVDTNNNKFWNGTLYDNDDVLVEWGRIGMKAQSKLHKGEGISKLEEKEREKLKKGYTHQKTIEVGKTTSSVAVVQKGDLTDIAKKQIKTGNPLLEKLIDRLVQANIHQITSSTQITFDAKTGLFSTPLGIVTKDGIDEARTILAQIKNIGKLDKAKREISLYMRIVPQNIGMKFNPESIFGSDELLRKQSDLLDSLESSYQALQTPSPSAPTSNKQEVVFDVKLDIVGDTKDRKRISDKFHETRKSMHSSSRLDVKEIYSVCISTVHAKFQEGKKVGNIMELWHGTKKANLLSILKSGLKVSPPSTAAIAGKMFGNGVYFSDQSTKSLNYAYGYWDGKYDNNCFMFLANVAMGKPYTPDSWGRGNLPRAGFDSTYAKAGVSGVMNNEMIVYNENQYDLTYLVEFEG